MNKFLKFTQLLVNQDGKAEEVGLIYIRPEKIFLTREIWDKHDVIISNATLICEMGSTAGLVVKGNIEEIMAQIEEDNIYE